MLPPEEVCPPRTSKGGDAGQVTDFQGALHRDISIHFLSAVGCGLGRNPQDGARHPD